MKNVLVLFSFLLAGSLANAGAQVGEWTVSRLTAFMANGSTQEQLNRHLIKDVNANGQALVEFAVLDSNGNVKSSDETWVDGSDIMSSSDSAMIVANCSNPQVGGVLETVEVPAGKFNSCKVIGKNEEGHPVTLWIAAVPFGLAKAKLVRPDYTLTQELLSSGTRQ